MMRSIIIAVALLYCFAAEADDLNGIIKGIVTDKTTHEPLAGVYVIYGKNLGITTGTDGSFLIENVSGNITITFQFIGYVPFTKDIFINNDETVELDISLETRVREMDQVVVSANRTEQRIAELSVSMDIIRSSFLTDNHITDAQEIMNMTPGIEVMDGQASVRGGSGYSYGVGSRVLALVDGLPMVSADAGNIKWQFLPLENLSQIEIIKGASSVLYGSSALNGVINFRTADATNIPVTQFYIETGIFGKPRNKDMVWWDTPRLFTNESFSHLQKIGNTDISLGMNLLIDEGYRRLNGEKLGRISLKLKHFNSRVEGLNYGVNLTSGYTSKTDFLLWEDADSGALKQSESTATEFHGTYIAVDPFISLRKSNRYQHDFRVRIQSSLNRLPQSPGNNSDAISVYSEYQGWFRIYRFLDLTAGVTENYAWVNSNFFGDHKYLNIAGFTQFEIRPSEKLKAVAGLRIENNSLDGINDRIVPVFRAGLNWQVADYTFLRASFGQGYRYPSIAEKFAATTLGSIKIIPNPDILPESGWSTEAGIKQGVTFGRITGLTDLSFFYMQSSDMIEYAFGAYPDQGFGFMAINNIRQARVYGSEVEFQLLRSFGEFKTIFTGGYTFIYPVEYDTYTKKNTDTYLKYRRMHSGKLLVKTEWKKFDIDLNFYVSSKILNIDDVFLTTSILPGFDEYWPKHNTAYGVIDGSFGYKLNNKYSLSFAVRNLTNTEYMGRPGDIQPQRNFNLRFSGKL